MYSPTGHSRCRLICFFVKTYLEILNIASLAHQWIMCGECVSSEYESIQLIKKTFTSNPHHSKCSINILCCEKLRVRKTHIHNLGISKTKQFLAKITIHINTSANEKVHPLLSSHIKIHQHICLELVLDYFCF